MPQKPLWVEAGDTFFTRSSTLLGRAIRWAETEPGEEKAWSNHTGVVVESGWVGDPTGAWSRTSLDPETAWAAGQAPKPAVVVEALWHARRGPLKLNGTDVRVFRPVPAYDATELSRFRAEAARYVGARYGWWKLAGFLVKRATGGLVDPTQWYWAKGRPICSFLAGHVNQAARPIGSVVVASAIMRRLADVLEQRGDTTARHLKERAWPGFGMAPQAADPDEMLDFALAHPESWREVL